MTWVNAKSPVSLISNVQMVKLAKMAFVLKAAPITRTVLVKMSAFKVDVPTLALSEKRAALIASAKPVIRLNIAHVPEDLPECLRPFKAAYVFPNLVPAKIAAKATGASMGSACGSVHYTRIALEENSVWITCASNFAILTRIVCKAKFALTNSVDLVATWRMIVAKVKLVTRVIANARKDSSALPMVAKILMNAKEARCARKVVFAKTCPGPLFANVHLVPMETQVRDVPNPTNVSAMPFAPITWPVSWTL